MLMLVSLFSIFFSECAEYSVIRLLASVSIVVTPFPTLLVCSLAISGMASIQEDSGCFVLPTTSTKIFFSNVLVSSTSEL
uniref:Secreted protein n=1 Tax=Anopheles darlingi TaxID=43151 RepID=A0A2M4DEI9_ANODA